MASSRLTCPECNATLKPAQPVPDGKKVKCPKCGVPFVAPGAVPAEVFELVEEDQPPAKQKAAPAPAKKAAAKKAVPKKGAAKKPSDDDEEGGTYSVLPGEAPGDEDDEKEKIDYAPDMSIKDLRGPAVGWIMRPSTWLLKCGVAGVLGWLGLIVAILIPILFPLPGGEEKPALAIGRGVEAMAPGLGGGGGMGGGMMGGMGMGMGQGAPQQQGGPSEKKEIKEAEEEEYENCFRVFGLDLRALAAVVITISVFGVFYSALIVVGSIKMQNMESRAWGMTAAILSLIPINVLGLELLSYILVFFLLMVFMKAAAITVVWIWIGVNSLYVMSIVGGIWSIVVLNKEEVVAGYEYVPD